MVARLGIKEFYDPSALESAQWSGFHDAHLFTGWGFPLLVVRIKFLHVLHNFPALGMRHAGSRLDDDCFGHLVGDDGSDALLAEITRRAFNGGGFAHVDRLL